jgi:hypothetical protein
MYTVLNGVHIFKIYRHVPWNRKQRLLSLLDGSLKPGQFSSEVGGGEAC